MASGKTWMPTVAGVLLTIDGVLALLRGIGRLFIGGALERPLLGLGLEIAGGFQIAIAALIIVGGVACLKRKMWALALIASILAVFVFPIIGLLGIIAVILVALSKKEFA